ncbi:MAG: 4-hydroxybenzoate octaprenyltransferase [Legionellales bacterium]|nr:4-hydroxybenzoate octaprenyltransferase [Legionellales bacterium]
MSLAERLHQYALLMRLDKPIGTFLLLWPTLWALWLANRGWPSMHLLIVFVLGTWLMRSAGCVINDIADRDFDGHVARTSKRPLAQKTIQPSQALMLFGGLISAAFILVLTLTPLAIGLAVVGSVIAVIYPFMKRFFHAPQLVLGLAFAWAIPMAYAATLNRIPADSWLLFAACFAWVVAYDTLYAMTDKADDLTLSIHSTAILFGSFDRLIIGGLQISVLLLLWGVAQVNQLTGSFYLALIGVAGLFIYQQWLIRHRQPNDCFTAFVNNHWVGLFVWLGILLHDWS